MGRAGLEPATLGSRVDADVFWILGMASRRAPLEQTSLAVVADEHRRRDPRHHLHTLSACLARGGRHLRGDAGEGEHVCRAAAQLAQTGARHVLGGVEALGPGPRAGQQPPQRGRVGPRRDEAGATCRGFSDAQEGLKRASGVSMPVHARGAGQAYSQGLIDWTAAAASRGAF
jgi:hypothetical protein